MYNLEAILEAFLLSLALSADSFAVALGYGINKIRINRISIVIISTVCAVVFTMSATAASITSQFMPQEAINYISFGILFLLGFIKLFQNSGKQGLKTLTIKESALLGFSMSADGLAAGISAGESVEKNSILITFTIIFILSIATTEAGNKIGFVLSNKMKLNISKLGAIMLIIMAFFKL